MQPITKLIAKLSFKIEEALSAETGNPPHVIEHYRPKAIFLSISGINLNRNFFWKKAD
jgi:hypothetical protein